MSKASNYLRLTKSLQCLFNQLQRKDEGMSNNNTGLKNKYHTVAKRILREIV